MDDKKPQDNTQAIFQPLTDVHNASIAMSGLQETLINDGYDVPKDPKIFSQKLSDPKIRKSLFDQLHQDKYDIPKEFDEFSGKLGFIKKKDNSTKTSKSLDTQSQYPEVKGIDTFKGFTPEQKAKLKTDAEKRNDKLFVQPVVSHNTGLLDTGEETPTQPIKKITYQEYVADQNAPKPLSAYLKGKGIKPSTIGLPDDTQDQPVSKELRQLYDYKLKKISDYFLDPVRESKELEITPNDDPYTQNLKKYAQQAKTNREANPILASILGTAKEVVEGVYTNLIKPTKGVADILSDVLTGIGVPPPPKFLSNEGISKEMDYIPVLGDLWNRYDEMKRNVPDLPKGQQGTFGGGLENAANAVLGGAAQLPGMMIGMEPGLIATGGLRAGKLGLTMAAYMGGQSGLGTYADLTEQGVPVSDKLKESTKAGLEGAAQGLAMEGISASAVGKSFGTAKLMGFLGWGMFDTFSQYAQNGYVDPYTAIGNGLFGGVVTEGGEHKAERLDLSSEAMGKRFDSWLQAKPEESKAISAIKTPIRNMRKTADKMAEQTVDPKDIKVAPNEDGTHDISVPINVEQKTQTQLHSLGMSELLTKIADTKEIGDDVAKRPQFYIDKTNELFDSGQITQEQKDLLLNKVKSDVENHDPIRIATEPLTNDIDKLNKQIEDIKNSTEHEVVKGVRIAEIDDQIKEKKAQIADIISGKKPEVKPEAKEQPKTVGGKSKEVITPKEEPITETEPKSALEQATKQGKKIYSDFDDTLFDPKTGELTDLGKDIKERISKSKETGEDISIATHRPATPENRAFIAEKLGIDPKKIHMGLDPEGKAEVSKDGVLIDDNPANIKAVKDRNGEVIEVKPKETVGGKTTPTEKKLSKREEKTQEKQKIKERNDLLSKIDFKGTKYEGKSKEGISDKELKELYNEHPIWDKLTPKEKEHFNLMRIAEVPLETYIHNEYGGEDQKIISDLTKEHEQAVEYSNQFKTQDHAVKKREVEEGNQQQHKGSDAQLPQEGDNRNINPEVEQGRTETGDSDSVLKGKEKIKAKYAKINKAIDDSVDPIKALAAKYHIAGGGPEGTTKLGVDSQKIIDDLFAVAKKAVDLAENIEMKVYALREFAKHVRENFKGRDDLNDIIEGLYGKFDNENNDTIIPPYNGTSKSGLFEHTIKFMSKYIKDMGYNTVNLHELENFGKRIINRLGEDAAYELAQNPATLETGSSIQTVRGLLLNSFQRQAEALAVKGEEIPNELQNKIDKITEVFEKEAAQGGQMGAAIKIFHFIDRDYMIRDLNKTRTKIKTEATKRIKEKAKQVVDIKKETTEKAVDQVDQAIRNIHSKSSETEKVREQRVKEAKDIIKGGLTKLKQSYKQTGSAPPFNLILEGVGEVADGLIRLGYIEGRELVEKIKQAAKDAGIDLSKYHQELTDLAKRKLDEYKFSGLKKQIEKENQPKVEKAKEVKKTVLTDYNDFKKQLKQIVKDNASGKKSRKEELVKKFVDELNLDKPSAEKVYDLIKKQADMLFDEEVKKVFKSKYGEKKEKVEKPKGEDKAFNKLVNAIKLGAFDEDYDEYAQGVTEYYGLNELTKSQAAELSKAIRLAQDTRDTGMMGDILAMHAAKLWDSHMPPEGLFKRYLQTGISLSYANLFAGLTTLGYVNTVPAAGLALTKPVEGIINWNRWNEWRKEKKAAKASGNTEKLNLLRQNSPLVDMAYYYASYMKNLGTTWNLTSTIWKYGPTEAGKMYESKNRKTPLAPVPNLEQYRYGTYRFKPITIGGKTYPNPTEVARYTFRALDIAFLGMGNFTRQAEFLRAIKEAKIQDAKAGTLKMNEDEEGRFQTENSLWNDCFSDTQYKKLSPSQRNVVDNRVAEYASKFTEAMGKKPSKSLMSFQRAQTTMKLALEKNKVSEQAQDYVTDETNRMIFMKGGGICTLFADAVTKMVNVNLGVKAATFSALPVVKILGPIGDAALDYVFPIGFMRANGIGITEILKKTGKFPDIKTGQAGAPGTEAWLRQMDKAWFGVATMVAGAALFMNDNNDNDITGSGRYDDISTRSKGHLPAYTVRIGGKTFNYLTIPQLVIPLGFFGELKDASRAGVFKENMVDIDPSKAQNWQDRKALLRIYGDCYMHSIMSIKDRSVLTGVQELFKTVSDALENPTQYKPETSLGQYADVKEKLPEPKTKFSGVLKNLSLFMAKGSLEWLPTRNNFLQQIIKFGDQKQREMVTPSDIMYYSLGVSQFYNKPALDVFGREVKSLPGSQQIYWPQDEDKYVDFVKTYKTFPLKLKPDEWYKYTDDKGKHSYRQLDSDDLRELSKLRGENIRKGLDKLMENEPKLERDRAKVIDKLGPSGWVRTTKIKKDVTRIVQEATRHALREFNKRKKQNWQSITDEESEQ